MKEEHSVKLWSQVTLSEHTESKEEERQLGKENVGEEILNGKYCIAVRCSNFMFYV